MYVYLIQYLGLQRTSTYGTVPLHSVKGTRIFVCACEVIGHGCVVVSVVLGAGEAVSFLLYF